MGEARLEFVYVVGEIAAVFVYVVPVVELGNALGCAVETDICDALAWGAGDGLVVLVVLADRC